jgi:hypothetical protein
MKANGGAASKAVSSRGAAATSRNNSVVLQNRSRGDVWDDNEWHSDKDHDEEPAQPAAARKTITRKVKTPADKTSSGKPGNVAAPQTDSNTSCLQALKEWRKKVRLTGKEASPESPLIWKSPNLRVRQIASKQQVAQTALLNEAILETIALIKPDTEHSLTENIEGMTEAKISQLGVRNLPSDCRHCHSLTLHLPHL